MISSAERRRRVQVSVARQKREKTRATATQAGRRAHAAQSPTGAAMRYTSALLKLVRGIHQEIRSAFDDATLREISTYVGHKDAATYGGGVLKRKIADLRVQLAAKVKPAVVLPAVDATAKDVSAHNAKEMKRLIGIDVAKRDFGIGPVIQKFREDNVHLIRSIPEKLLDQVESTISENTNMRVEDLAKLLQERFEVSESRAKLIAVDQTLKLNGQITKTRQQSSGITEYIWITSNDERVRGDPGGKYPEAEPSHYAREGQRFSWATSPEGGHPGEDYRCRCTAYPCIPEADEGFEISI